MNQCYDTRQGWQKELESLIQVSCIFHEDRLDVVLRAPLEMQT